MSNAALDNSRPHDDKHLATAERRWPTKPVLDRLTDELQACPASFVLSAGDYVHINKGRLHAFRKHLPKRSYAEEPGT